MNAELEAKTADIVKQADQLMVRFIVTVLNKVPVHVLLLSGNFKEITISCINCIAEGT